VPVTDTCVERWSTGYGLRVETRPVPLGIVEPT